MSASSHRPIAEINREREALRGEMAELSQAWLAVVAQWLAEDWNLVAQRAVRSDPGRVQQLADEGELSQVKQELKELVQAAPQLVQETLGGDPKIWSHIEGHIFTVPGVPDLPNTRSYMSATNAQPEAFDLGLRLLKGEVYVLLTKHRLGKALDRSQWKEVDGRLRYPFNVTWSAGMQSRLAAYSDAYRRSVELAEELAVAAATAAADQAQALWDKA